MVLLLIYNLYRHPSHFINCRQNGQLAYLTFIILSSQYICRNLSVIMAVNKHFFTFFIFVILLVAKVNNATAQDSTVADYITVPGPIQFANDNYFLAWSAKPTDNYYKQEYLPKGDSVNHYNKMVLIDVLYDTSKPRDLVYYKLNALAKRKKTDAAVDYHLIQSPDSSAYILDFAESEGFPRIKFVEWNAYLYKNIKDVKGRKAILLFGISIRGYDDKVTGFIDRMGDMREKILQQLIHYQPPLITRR